MGGFKSLLKKRVIQKTSSEHFESSFRYLLTKYLIIIMSAYQPWLNDTTSWHRRYYTQDKLYLSRFSRADALSLDLEFGIPQLLITQPRLHSSPRNASHVTKFNSSPLPCAKWLSFWQNTFSNAFPWMKMIEFRFNFVLMSRIDNKPACVQIMAWCRTGEKPLHKPMLAQFPDPCMRH